MIPFRRKGVDRMSLIISFPQPIILFVYVFNGHNLRSNVHKIKFQFLPITSILMVYSFLCAYDSPYEQKKMQSQ